MHLIATFILVCDTPPNPDPNSMTTPTDITGVFLAGDTIEYSCNGDLIPDAPVILTCTDIGQALAVWFTTTIFSNCSKYITSFDRRIARESTC